MPRLSPTIALLLPLTVGCGSKDCPPGSELRGDGLCYLIDSAPDDIGTTGTTADTADSGDTADTGDTGSTGPTTYTYGDPIIELGTYGEPPGGIILYEWTDAAAIDDDWVIVTGQGGYGIVSMADGELVHQENLRRALRVATDGQHAILASRTDGFQLIDVSAGPDTRGSLEFRAPPYTTAHEDVDIDGDLVAVGWRSEGLVLLDLSGNLVSTVAAGDAFAVALQPDRLVYTDATALILLDITDPTAPIELDRQTMAGEGRDLSWEGEHVVVGMGGIGTGIWQVVDDTLTHRTDVRTPGSALSVAVDGDRAWIGAWATTALVDLAAEPPVVLGHEAPQDSAMGVAASGGRALVADWFYSTALEAVDGTAGPEIEPTAALYFDQAVASSQAATFENHGVHDLEVTFGTPGAGFEVSDPTITVAPGASGSVVVRWPSDSRPPNSTLSWTSNDPDEPSGTVALGPADQGVGTSHEDFSAPGFQLPDTDERIYTLSEARGKVVVLVYWALF